MGHLPYFIISSPAPNSLLYNIPHVYLDIIEHFTMREQEAFRGILSPKTLAIAGCGFISVVIEEVMRSRFDL